MIGNNRRRRRKRRRGVGPSFSRSTRYNSHPTRRFSPIPRPLPAPYKLKPSIVGGRRRGGGRGSVPGRVPGRIGQPRRGNYSNLAIKQALGSGGLIARDHTKPPRSSDVAYTAGLFQKSLSKKGFDSMGWTNPVTGKWHKNL